MLTSSTPFEYPQVISRRFAWPILMFPQVSAFSVAGSIPSISTFQWLDQRLRGARFDHRAVADDHRDTAVPHREVAAASSPVSAC